MPIGTAVSCNGRCQVRIAGVRPACCGPDPVRARPPGVQAALATCDWTAEAIETTLRAVCEQLELKPRVVFGLVRVAVTGSSISPGLFESVHLLGRDEALARLSTAAARLA